MVESCLRRGRVSRPWLSGLMAVTVAAGVTPAAAGTGAGAEQPLSSSRITAIDVGAPGGRPVALSERGHVVHWVPSPVHGQSEAFRWHRGTDVALTAGLAPGAASEPVGVSDHGDVVGWVTDPTGSWDGFVWHDGVATRLADSPGDTVATDIDEHGRVLVNRAPAGSSQGYRAGVIEDGREIAAPDVLDGVAPWGRDLGGRGEAILNAYSPAAGAHAFAWRPGRTPIDLGTLGGPSTEALQINRAGTVIGTSMTAAGYRRMFVWRGGRMSDLGTLGGAHTREAASTGALPDLLNDRGDVAGTSELPSGELHAFLWSRGRMRDLGTLGGPTSHGYGINDHRDVVGTSLTATGETHAFLWRDGVMTDLGASVAGESSGAVAINDRGQVLGFRWDDLVFQTVVWETSRR